MRNVTNSYRAMSDGQIDRYLLKLRKRIRGDQRPDPAAQTLPELDAYVKELAEAGNRRKRTYAAMLEGAGRWGRLW